MLELETELELWLLKLLDDCELRELELTELELWELSELWLESELSEL